MRNIITTAVLATIICVTGAMSLGLLYKDTAEAQSSSGSISGYSWSETIGWISWDGSNYGIDVASDGTLSGYGWSENIGWVSANSSDLSGCPSSPCSASIDGDGNLSGWMKAIAGGSDGWDGFISLSGSNYGPEADGSGNFSGYAWGSDVVGWLDFSYATTDFVGGPTAELKVRKVGDTTWSDSLTIEPTEEIEVGWNQDGAGNSTSCEAVPPTYNFSTGSATDGIDSDVDEPIGGTNHTFGLVCYGSGSSQTYDSVEVETNGGVGAQFTCPADYIRRGEDVTLCWEVGTNDPAACSINAGAVSVLSPVGTNTGSVTYPMYGEITFTLECTGGDSDTMTVKVLPEIQET